MPTPEPVSALVDSPELEFGSVEFDADEFIEGAVEFEIFEAPGELV
jgi:hypothetical protein